MEAIPQEPENTFRRAYEKHLKAEAEDEKVHDPEERRRMKAQLTNEQPKYKGEYVKIKQQGKGRQDEESRKMAGQIRRKLARTCTLITEVKKETEEELKEHFRSKHDKFIDKLLPRREDEVWNAKRRRKSLMEAQLHEIKEELKRVQDEEKENKKTNFRKWTEH